MTAERGRYVVHLPVLAPDLAGAKWFARAISRALGFLGDVDRGEITVSGEDAQDVHHRIFCDQLFGGRRRCPLPADHDGPCGPPGGTDRNPGGRTVAGVDT